MSTEKDLSQKYQIKDEIQHILDRQGMWVGSTITEVMDAPLYYPTKNMLIMKEGVPFNQGLNKLIDEVFSNSVDEYRRSKQLKKDSLFDITKITVEVNTDGHVVITDDGGIPVQKHSQTGEYIPYMIFGMLRTSSNYDDTQNREVVGTNGLGAKLTNIFSKSFRVETCDGKNMFDCTWKNNMHEFEMQPIKKTKEHFTRITFDIDLKRFEDMDVIDTGTLRLLQRRCIDSAASNPGLIVEFKSDSSNGVMNSTWKFVSFKEYIELFIDRSKEGVEEVSEDGEDGVTTSNIIEYRRGKDSIYIVYGSGLPNIGFVNGVMCSEGTHIKKVQSQIVNKMMELCKKNNMEVITERDILARFSVFVNCTIINPQYDSQAKTRLSTKIDDNQLQFDNKFLNDLKKSGLYRLVADYYDIKYKEVKKKELRKLNQTIKSTKIKKLIAPGITDSQRNEIFIFEGNSAAGGFRKCRNAYQAAYLLRGKIKNTLNLNRDEILQNQELRELLAILRLSFADAKDVKGKQDNLKNLSMNKIIFCTDMDYDGHHICGLLITFFKKHFPELFEAKKIYRALSPIVIAEKGNDVVYFYSMDDYERRKDTLKGYEFRYTKGLGGLVDRDYEEMLNNQKLVEFYADKNTDETINVWFDKSSEMRKEILMQDNTDEP